MTATKKTNKIDQKKLDRAAEVMRALAHPLRLAIIEFIDKNKTVNVNKIYGALKIEQSITSQHLRILRLADIVNYEREGKKIHYSINYKNVKYLNKKVRDFYGKKK